jgi:acylphosphatase
MPGHVQSQSMAKNQRLHAWVEGHVQGVGFRYFVRESISSLSITGWVRNLHDGRVELIAEGSRDNLEKLLSAVNQGPRGSHVINVRTEWGIASGEFNSFRVQPTA